MQFKVQHLLLACSLSVVSACALPNNSEVHTHEDGVIEIHGSKQELRIAFAAEVNGRAFKCGEAYEGVGQSGTTLKPQDFRFYVSQLHVINAQGEKVPVVLEQNKWQNQNLALLDFEDKTADCSSGTSETHMEITGHVPEGEYKGLSFELGVPFEQNHQDSSAASAPLNLTSMFWNWRGGYKFMRLDFSTIGMPQGYFVHLGSTGCTGMAMSQASTPATTALTDEHAHHALRIQADEHSAQATASSTTAPAQCDNPNRPVFTLQDYEADKHKVVADIGALLSQSNLDENQPESAQGCMSSPDDGDCGEIFKGLGLPFPGIEKPEAHFFALKPM